MAKLKHYEYSGGRDRRENKEGLKQRRLKDEARWKFRPTKDYAEESQEEDDDLDFDDLNDENDYR